MEAIDQFHVPALYLWGKGTAFCLIAGWVGYRAGSFVVEKICCFFLESKHSS